MISQALTIVASWRAGRHPPACFKRMRARVLSASCKHPAGARARRLPRRVRTGCAVRACARMPTCPAAVAPQRHSGQMTAQAASVSAMPPSVPSRVLRVPRIRCRPNRRPTALAAESATPSDTMPAKASARSCTHSPAGVVAALVSHTGAAMPGRAAADIATAADINTGSRAWRMRQGRESAATDATRAPPCLAAQQRTVEQNLACVAHAAGPGGGRKGRHTGAAMPGRAAADRGPEARARGAARQGMVTAATGALPAGKLVWTSQASARAHRRPAGR